jgi:hypothetical protein
VGRNLGERIRPAQLRPFGVAEKATGKHNGKASAAYVSHTDSIPVDKGVLCRAVYAWGVRGQQRAHWPHITMSISSLCTLEGRS